MRYLSRAPAVILAAGCPPGGEAASAPAGCPLTAEDVSAALGEQMVQPDGATSGSTCSFEPAELPDTGPFIDYRPSSTAAIEAFAAGGSEAVDGVGDEAWFDETFGNLAVREGDTAFEVQLNEFDGDVRATVVEVAQVALGAG